MARKQLGGVEARERDKHLKAKESSDPNFASIDVFAIVW